MNLKCGFIKVNEKEKIFYTSLINENPVGSILIAPPYARTAREMFMLAYYLFINNWNVYRFDPRNHVGYGSGDILNYKLSTLQEDLRTVYDKLLVERKLPIICLSLSLSSPIVWRFATEQEDIKGIVSLVGVVNIEKTIGMAGEFLSQSFRGKVEEDKKLDSIFGYEVNVYNFVKDMDEKCYGTLQDTMSTLKDIKVPLHLFSADKDEYVAIDEVKQCTDKNKEFIKWEILKDTTHRIGDNIAEIKKVSEKIVHSVYEIIGNESKEVYFPTIREVVMSNRQECDEVEACLSKI